MLGKYIGLLFACPLGEEADDCPLREIRKQDIMSRVAWAMSLSTEASSNIISWHQLCYDRRINEAGVLSERADQ